MMSSSEIEEASIGVPSLLAMDIRHNLSRSILVDGTSQSLEAVTEEVTDIFENFTQLHCDVEDPAVSQLNNHVTGCYRSSACKNSKKRV